MAPTATELPIFRTEEIPAKLMAIYDKGLRHWPVPFETFFVNTRYGQTHVIVSGDPAAPPLVMTHPAAVGGFVWSSTIAPLSQHRRVDALDTIGDFGRSELAEPDAAIGYCYGPNRLGFGLIDQRELVLRDTLYRDMVGERPQCPTQRRPPPKAPAGDLQPATPRRSDPEHPPLGPPGNPCERFQHGERIEMATVNAFTDNLNGQGFGYLDQEAKSRYALPLRFTPAVGTILIVIGLVLRSPIWLGSLAVVALSGALFPRHMFIDLIYNLGVRYLFRGPPLPPTPKPRRFSYLISTSSLAGAALSFYYGLPVLGLILGGMVAIGATILATTLWCLGSWIYRIIFVPAAARLGWNPM